MLTEMIQWLGAEFQIECRAALRNLIVYHLPAVMLHKRKVLLRIVVGVNVYLMFVFIRARTVLGRFNFAGKYCTATTT